MQVQTLKYRFHFQVRASPAPLNILTPTPAPDQGGQRAQGSWLKAYGSCLKARGSRLRAHGQEKFAAGSPRPGLRPWVLSQAMSHAPWAKSLEAWALSHEPVTIDNRLDIYFSTSRFQIATKTNVLNFVTCLLPPNRLLRFLYFPQQYFPKGTWAFLNYSK